MPEALLLRQLPHAGKLILRGSPEVRERAGTVLGFPLPERPLTATVGEGAEALWLGPDEWLLLVPAASVDAVEAALRTELTGLHHALVAVGERFVGLAVEGDQAADILNAGCPLDLHPRAFPEGSSTRTLLAKAEIVLHRPEGGSGFRLYAGRSFAAYVWRYLEAAGREHGLRVAA
jgi:sarcosine oxidase subunit gamma